MKKNKIVLYISLIVTISIELQAQAFNLGKIDHNITIQKYKNLSQSFDQAFVGIPKGVLGRDRPFYGTYTQLQKEMPNLKIYTKKLPVILYMQSSEDFTKGEKIREWVTGEGGYIFFAPNTHAVKGHPKYNPPLKKEYYEEVHNFRQAEISLFVSNIKEIPFVDLKRTFLMGYAEGGLAVARYRGDEFVGRIILAWDCRRGYYTDNPKIGAKRDDPVLNIVGREDTKSRGDCGDALFDFNNSKVVLLPKRGENIIESPFVKDEILDFIERFKNYKVK